MPDRETLDRLEALFFEVLELPENERPPFLARRCGGDAALRRSLERMLQTDREGGGLIDAVPWSAEALRTRLGQFNDDDPLSKPGSQVGPYTLMEPVGVGGMGTVWLARRTSDEFHQRVALKLIKRGLDTDDILRRFRSERKILGQLEHPNIARLIDGGATSDGRPYLVMEFVDGEPIDRWCDRQQLPIRDRLQLFRTVCAAVQYAHGNLIVHRDLKPSNILINGEGQPKLLDFGLAKILRTDADHEMSVTQENRRILTPRYASPEQMRGERVSVATDVYSLGVVLFELMTNRSPYHSDRTLPHEWDRMVLDHVIELPSVAVQLDEGLAPGRHKSWSRSMRGEIDAICMTALQKVPAQRYHSVFELGEDIRRHLEGLPLLAKPPGRAVRVIRALRRRKSLIAAVLAGIVVGTALAALFVIRTFLIPQWQEEHIRRARLAVIGNQGNSAVYEVLFMTRLNWDMQKVTQPGLEWGELADAASAYDAASRLGGIDKNVEIESLMVRLTQNLRTGLQSTDGLLATHAPRIPLTYAYLNHLLHEGKRLRFSDAQFESASPSDLRALGLISLFISDLKCTIDSWTRLPMTESDPMIECLLGYIYLALDIAEQAYPRLLSAYRAYPESGTIALYLADAAARVGDLPQAEYYLSVAGRLGNRDQNFAHERIRMLLHLGKGEEESAVALLCNGFCGRNAVAELQFARYQESTYGLESALRALSGRIGVRPSKSRERATHEYFARLLEAWWGQTDEAARRALIEESDGAASLSPEEFREYVHRYSGALKTFLLDGHEDDDLHQLYERARWTRLARWTDPAMHEKSRMELLQLARRFPEMKLWYSCALQCTQPSPNKQALNANTSNAVAP